MSNLLILSPNTLVQICSKEIFNDNSCHLYWIFSMAFTPNEIEIQWIRGIWQISEVWNGSIERTTLLHVSCWPCITTTTTWSLTQGGAIKKGPNYKLFVTKFSKLSENIRRKLKMKVLPYDNCEVSDEHWWYKTCKKCVHFWKRQGKASTQYILPKAHDTSNNDEMVTTFVLTKSLHPWIEVATREIIHRTHNIQDLTNTVKSNWWFFKWTIVHNISALKPCILGVKLLENDG